MAQDMNKQALPPLKWAGGKRWLIPKLKEILPRDLNIIEPFCGGLAISLGLKPKHAILNDLNPHLINFYKQVQNGLNIQMDMEYDKNYYYERREEFNSLIEQNTIENPRAAGLFYYLNRSCFNGLCRFNKKGFFNVPFGRYKKVSYRTSFLELQKMFEDNWVFQCSDFRKLEYPDNYVIYADPPYDVEFTQYCQTSFTWQDQIDLAQLLAKYSGGPVVVSNQATDRILDLYNGLGFDIELLDGPRRISRTGDRTPAKEILATKGK